ncbi:MAG TPA: BLUF domain-containing protein [Verrucomicrobiae bacterium]|nr:BLUF domain-containing protein [Verrucomicrobiae bacterium]
MKNLFWLVYVSAASKPFSKGRLRDLVQDSRRLNATCGLTGMLLHKDSHFMQALEGAEQAVMSAFGRISRDPRHFGIIVLIKESADKRHFPGQPMAFRNLDLAEQRTAPGYAEFLDTPLTGKEFASRPSRCEKLLLLFKPGTEPQ